MFFKFIAIFALVAVASAGHLNHLESKTIEEFNSHPEYTFNYGVEDSISGDSKSQTETRHGDVVHGEYSLNDADGFRRTVKYTADSLNGFNAVVDRKPLVEAVPVAVKTVEHVEAPVAFKTIEHAPTPAIVKTVEHHSAPVVVKTVEHAPILVKTVAPIAYSAPTLVKSFPISYSAPIAYTSPIHIKSVPTYVAKSTFEPTLTYTSGPVVHHTYSAPTLVKSAPFAYAGPLAYTKSIPAVSQW